MAPWPDVGITLLMDCLLCLWSRAPGSLPDTTASIARAPLGVLEECSALVVSAEYRHQPLLWLESRPGSVFGGSPRDVVDREPRRDYNGRGRYPGEGHDVPIEVGLVGIAALRRHQGGAVTRGEAVDGVVETDEQGGALGGEADLGPEP